MFSEGYVCVSDRDFRNFRRNSGMNEIMLRGIAAYDPLRMTRKEPLPKKSHSKGETSSPKEAADTFEPSAAARERLRLIEMVKNKINTGYYNSEEVSEDLADSFAKAFDQALRG